MITTIKEINCNNKLYNEEEIEDTNVDTGFDPKFLGSNMPKLTAIKIEDVNKEKANHLLYHNVYKDQRPTKIKRQEELERKMKDGRFHGSDIALAHLNFDYIGTNGKITRKLLLNGQHTLKAIDNSNTVQKLTIKEFLVETHTQLSCLFAQFDAPGGNRTSLDVAQTYIEDFPGFSKKAIDLISNGVRQANQFEKYGKSGLNHDKCSFTVEERIELMRSKKYLDAANFANQYVKGENNYLQRKDVVAVMTLSYNENSKDAKIFWDKVHTGADCSQNSPELALRTFLSNCVIRSRGVNKKTVTPADVFLTTHKAWKSFISGEPVARLHIPSKKKRKV